MKIAVGSLNPSKISAAQRATTRVWPHAELCAVDAPSGVAVQPMTDDEAMAGARTRAQGALDAVGAELGIGIEGNVADTTFGMFVTAWAVALDTTGVVGIGAGGRFLLPAKLAEQVRRGHELGPLMDRLIGKPNTKHHQGAVGILTGGLIPRDAALETAVTFALTRFIVPDFYRDD